MTIEIDTEITHQDRILWVRGVADVAYDVEKRTHDEPGGTFINYPECVWETAPTFIDEEGKAVYPTKTLDGLAWAKVFEAFNEMGGEE